MPRCWDLVAGLVKMLSNQNLTWSVSLPIIDCLSVSFRGIFFVIGRIYDLSEDLRIMNDDAQTPLTSVSMEYGWQVRYEYVVSNASKAGPLSRNGDDHLTAILSYAESYIDFRRCRRVSSTTLQPSNRTDHQPHGMTNASSVIHLLM